MIHLFKQPIASIPLPQRFTYPFHYTPHPLCVLASEEVKKQIATHEEWQEELSKGKMFGVLLVELPVTHEVAFLAAFSGNLAGSNAHPFFVPPIYDLLQPEGFFKKEEEEISSINGCIAKLEKDKDYQDAIEKLSLLIQRAKVDLESAKAALKTAKANREKRRQSALLLSDEEQALLIAESQHQKAAYKRLEKEWQRQIDEATGEVQSYETAIERLKVERKERSATLQQQLFEQFRLLNAQGEEKDLCTIFKETVHKTPPAGTGECALPKLLQYAYLHRLKPLAMAEFWWGHSPKTEVRHHGNYYPSCKGKCEPILQHMLQGLEVEHNPLATNPHQEAALEVVYEDDYLVIINKPAGMLSVPGKEDSIQSLYHCVKAAYPQATGPLLVHRLDMATSGLLVVAKTKEVHQKLQAQFINRSIKKRYVALLDGKITKIEKSGVIELPLTLNLFDRPRQMVSWEQGKQAITAYEVLNEQAHCTRIAFYPHTGRTHQLRIHAAHAEGLGCPIRGDELYGKRANRLYLHAESIEFIHPISGKVIHVEKEADF